MQNEIQWICGILGVFAIYSIAINYEKGKGLWYAMKKAYKSFFPKDED
jgi:hypothetical protein